MIVTTNSNRQIILYKPVEQNDYTELDDRLADLFYQILNERYQIYQIYQESRWEYYRNTFSKIGVVVGAGIGMMINFFLPDNTPAFLGGLVVIASGTLGGKMAPPLIFRFYRKPKIE